jgi:hypothetical protein
MPDRRAVTYTRTLQWIAFLLLLSAAVGLATRSVLVRVRHIRAADTSVSAFIRRRRAPLPRRSCGWMQCLLGT